MAGTLTCLVGDSQLGFLYGAQAVGVEPVEEGRIANHLSVSDCETSLNAASRHDLVASNRLCVL